VNFLGGETYSGLLYKLIPRLFWPGKPAEFSPNDFGQIYGFLDLTDDITAVNMPWMVEGYANYGIIGVLVACMVMGPLLGAFDNIFNRDINSESDKIIPAMVGLSFIWPESHLSGVAGGIMQNLIIIYATLLATLGVRRRS
jgi:hypothetical protein